MSTPAPEPAPFDPHDFPDDLRTAQRDATRLHAELEAHGATLPWSREAHPGFPEVTDRGRERPGRPASPGWTPEQAAEKDRLAEALRHAALTVHTHPWWARCAKEGVAGPGLVEARQALKQAPGAVPDQVTAMVQEDAQKAA